MVYITDIDVLLIGKTGNGKSALGNSILKRDRFSSSSSSTSETKEVSYEIADYKGLIIKVVDGPGVGDTCLTNEDAVQQIVDSMTYAMSLNTRGFHAFLLVVRFGDRFTKEDLDAVQLLKNMFGLDFVSQYCILVMTCGDNFEREARKSGLTFEEWCQKQKGTFQELLKECQGRIVLFDNVTENEVKRDRQIDQLLDVVNSLQFQGHRYTNERFRQVESSREKALVESKMPRIREEILQETSLMQQKLEQVTQQYERENQIPHLEPLLKRCDELVQNLQEEDKGTGALHQLENNVVSLRKTVSDTISFQTALAEQTKQTEAKHKEMKDAIEKMLAEKKIDEEQYKKRVKKLEKEIQDEKNTTKTKQQEQIDAYMREFKKKSDEMDAIYKQIKDDSFPGFGISGSFKAQCTIQ